MNANLELPLFFNINKPSDWLDFFQKRLDEQTLLTESSNKTERSVKKKKIKNVYEKFICKRNQYGTTDDDINELKQYADSKDNYNDKDSAQGDRFTPLARRWIDQEMKKFLLERSDNNNQQTLKEEEEQQLIPNLHNLDFELKYHIICFIPTYSKRDTVSARSSPTNNIFNLYFNGKQQKGIPTIQQLDSDFISFHKYRLISKEVKRRMERKLLEMEIENFNTANIFMKFFNNRTNQFEVDLNNLDFMNRLACLLCYFNSRKEYLGLQKLKKLSLLKDGFEIYEKVDIVKYVVKRTLSEMYHLKIDNSGLIANNSVPYEQKKDTFSSVGSKKESKKNERNIDIDIDREDDIDWYGEEENEEMNVLKREETIELSEDKEEKPFLLSNNNNGTTLSTEDDGFIDLPPQPPKKAPSAHKLYHLENRQKVKEQYPQMTYSEVTTELVSLWDAIGDEERKTYREKARKGLLVYYKEYDEYEKKKKEYEEKNEDGLELTEEELIQEVDDRSTSTNVFNVYNYNSLFLSKKQEESETKQEENEIKKKIDSIQEQNNITLVTPEEIEFENEDLSITEPSKLSLIYHTNTENVKPKDDIVTIPTVYKSEYYTSISLIQSFNPPFYQFEGYLSKALRYRLVKALPTLFGNYEHLGLSDIDKDVMNSVVLCKNVVVFGMSPWTVLTNLLLHIFIEKGVASPPSSSVTTSTTEIDEKEEIIEENNNETLFGVEGLTLVNFTYDQLLQSFSNDRSYHVSRGNYDTKPTNECAILGKFRNTVKHINLIDYGEYTQSLCNEVMVLVTFFLPNLTSMNVIAKTREYSPATTQLDTVFNGTETDISTCCISLKENNNISKIVIVAEGRTPSHIDVSSLGIFDLVDTQLDIEKEKKNEKTFYLRLMVTPQVTVETLSKLVDEHNLRLEVLPLVSRSLFQTNGLSILEKKKIIDYIVKEKHIPVEMIDCFIYDYSEEYRVLTEYCSCLCNLYCNGRLTNFNHLIFDSNILWLTTLMYFGFDIRGKVENSTQFEEIILGLQLAAPTMIQVEKEVFNPLYDIFISILYKRYAPKEKFIEFLDKKMKIFIYDKNPSIEKLSTLIDELDKEKIVTLSNDLLDGSEKMLRQLYIQFFNNPNCQVELNADKLFILLVISIFERDVKKVDAIFTLEKYIPNFTEVFKKTITFQYLNRGVSDYYSNTNNTIDATNYSTNKYDPQVIDVEKWVTRKWSMIQAMYKNILPKHENFYKLSSLKAEEEEIESIEFNILNLVIAQEAPISLISSIISRMSLEDLLYQDNLGNTCLHLCILQGLTKEKLYSELLSKQPKLANVLNYQLNSPLHFACHHPFGTLRLIGEKLVKGYEANVNIVNCYGMTPFEVALLWGSKKFMNGLVGDSVVDWISVLGPKGWLRPTLRSKKEMWKKMLEKL
ncbi:hypothetical protein ABK040_012897 [Willaertia magna]